MIAPDLQPAIIVEDCDLEIEAGDADDTDTAVERRAKPNMKNIGDYILVRHSRLCIYMRLFWAEYVKLSLKAFVLTVRRKCRRALTVKNIEDELRFEFVN